MNAASQGRTRNARKLAAPAAARMVLLLAIALPTQARVFMTQRQALAGAFPAGARIMRETFFLKPEQVSAAKGESGVEIEEQLLIRYAATSGGKTIGYAYFDTHRVRTLPESLMIVVTAEGAIDRIEILSFDEPSDYFPKRRWIDQLLGRKLDNELSLNRAIRPISGASLTGRAIVNASRKVLALHHALAGVAPRSTEAVP